MSWGDNDNKENRRGLQDWSSMYILRGAGYVHSLYYTVAHTEETGSILTHAPQIQRDTYPHPDNSPFLRLPSADTHTGPYTDILGLIVNHRDGLIS
jgi:hypothetical protein